MLKYLIPVSRVELYIIHNIYTQNYHILELKKLITINYLKWCIFNEVIQKTNYYQVFEEVYFQQSHTPQEPKIT